MRSTSGRRLRLLVPVAAVAAVWLTTAAPANASTYTITPGGAPVVATTDQVDEKARLSFDGTAGQRVSIQLSDVTIGPSNCCSARLSLLKPNGTALTAASYFGENGAFFDTKTLPVDGEYKIVLDPVGDAKGSATVTLYDVPPNASVPIVAGGPAQTMSLLVPGQNGNFRFDGLQGQRVSLELTDLTMTSARVSLIDPEGNVLLNPATVGTAGAFLGPRTLPMDGEYRVFFDPRGARTGDATLTLHDVPANVSDSLVFGTPYDLTIAAPGQNARLTFAGTEGQRFSILLSDVAVGDSPGSGVQVSVLKPNGNTLVPAISVGTTGGFVDATTIPTTGEYEVVVNPVSTATGTMTLTLYDVPPNESGELTFGEPHVFTVGTPGQNSTHTFEGTKNDRISLDISDVTIALSKVSLINPDGSKLIFPTNVDDNGAFFDTKTLPLTGTYKVQLNPTGGATGDATLTVYDVPADATGSLTVDGEPVVVSLETPGQDAELTFSGTTGQALTLDLSSVTIGTSGCCSAEVTVFEPSGGKERNATFFGTIGASFNLTLEENGTYRVVIDPLASNTGDVTVDLTTTPAP